MGEPDDADDELSNSVLFGRPKGSLTDKGFAFLDPPRGPGELGWLADFRVIRVLGKGGMGVVFEAEDTALRRTVALKVLRPELTADPESRERFLREARAVAALHSEHVVTIYQVGKVREVPFLAMQYLHGETLQQRLERPPRLGLKAAVTIARQAAAGLAAAHAAGLIHRDVKPSNIWLASDPSGAAFKGVRLLDFGLARLARGEPGITATGVVVGTPNYMSPEQANGLPIDHRADLFGLGCVLYVMLTGELAFAGDSTLAVLSALALKTPPPVAARNPAVPAAVSDFVARLLAKDPADRPQSADEVVAALDAFLAAAPTDSRPSAVPPAPPAPETQALADGPTHPDEVARPAAGRGPGGRRRALLAAAAAAGLAALGAAAWFALRPAGPAGDPIRVGVLHSQTGTMAMSERPLIDATVLAVEELNRAGGVLGRPVEAVLADGRSDPDVFAAEAERLIRQEKAAALFGCMMSPSRKAVRDVVERSDGLLFYPVSYEGLETSPRIVYTGAAPNQKLLPSVDFLIQKLGKQRLFIVGSDLVSPRAATEVIRDHVRDRHPGAVVVRAEFVPLGSAEVGPLVDAIEAAGPDAVLNILNGTSMFHFFAEFRRRGHTPAALPTMSIAMTEHDLSGVDVRAMAGDYLAGNYFQSLDREQSRAFVAKVRARFGADRVVTDNMTAAYTGVHLWAKAVAKANRPDPGAVAEAVAGVEYDGPGGLIRVDETNRHVWRPARVGRVRGDGTVEVVYDSGEGIRADPFPASRPRAEWERVLTSLYVGWNGRWQAPARP